MIHGLIGRRGRAIRLVLAGWAVVTSVVLLAPPAGAHAALVSTDPAEGTVLAESPAQLTLTFNEPVTLAASSTTLYDAAGDGIDAPARSVDEQVVVTPAGRLGDGTYVLVYRVISADGHPIAGSLSFSVGTPSESVVSIDTSGTDPAVRAVHGALQGATYLGLLLASGLVAFVVVLLPRREEWADVQTTLVRLVRGGAILGAIAVVGLVPVSVAYQQGLALGGVLSGASWTSWLSEDGLMSGLVAGGLLVAAITVPRRPGPLRASGIVALDAALVALAAPVLVGHTRAFGPTWLVVSSDVVHLLAGAIWFGGLVGLAVCVRRATADASGIATVLARFSTVAAGSLLLVAAAGGLLGWRILGSWSALTGTSYGVLLLIKVGIVAGVAAVAGWNRFRLLPAVQHAIFDGDASAPSRFGRTVRLEALGLLVVVLLTGFLVNTVPVEDATAITARPGTTMVDGEVGGVRVLAHLDPAAVGPNTIQVRLETAAGEALLPYAPPVITLASESVSLDAPAPTELTSAEFETEVVIPTAGDYRLRVSVRVDEFTNPVVDLPVYVAGR